MLFWSVELAGGLLTQSLGCGKRRKSCFVIYSDKDHAVRISFPRLRVLCRKREAFFSLYADSVRVNTRLWFNAAGSWSKVCSLVNDSKHCCANSNRALCAVAATTRTVHCLAIASTANYAHKFKQRPAGCWESVLNPLRRGACVLGGVGGRQWSARRLLFQPLTQKHEMRISGPPLVGGKVTTARKSLAATSTGGALTFPYSQFPTTANWRGKLGLVVADGQHRNQAGRMVHWLA
jgi:hypothetical protein